MVNHSEGVWRSTFCIFIWKISWFLKIIYDYVFFNYYVKKSLLSKKVGKPRPPWPPHRCDPCIGDTSRSSLSQMFFRIGLLKNFANFIGKHQCWSIFSIKLQTWTLLTRDSIFLRTPSFTEHLQWLLLNKSRRPMWFIVWRSDTLVI